MPVSGTAGWLSIWSNKGDTERSIAKGIFISLDITVMERFTERVCSCNHIGQRQSKSIMRKQEDKNVCCIKGKMFIISGFSMRGNDSPLSLWNFLHVFTATNISSLFTGSPFDKNRRHESKTKAHISHISKPEARHVLQLNRLY